jgi:2,5-dioxopentanoate dehydrogenase
MTLQPVLIAGEWRLRHSVGEPLAARNPATGQLLGERYPISGWTDIEAALLAARDAQSELGRRPDAAEALAALMEAYAARLEARAEELVEQAHTETALAREPRLRQLELPRTTNQLRQAAAAARERNWRHAVIDTRAGLRSYYAPLDGPIFVIGPSNFPFAFNGVSGGDFAAALATGHPVIAKAHPGHPGVSRVLAEAAWDALAASDLPRALVQMVYHLEPEDGLRLAGHPMLGATAFTGSRASGLRLKGVADAAGKPIYLEMSSINPVFILPGALAERGEAIAAELSASALMGVGQFCTSPGLVFMQDDNDGLQFVERLADHFRSAPVGVLLDLHSAQRLSADVSGLCAHGAHVVIGGKVLDEPGLRYANTLLQVSGDEFLRHAEALQREAFGPALAIVLVNDLRQMVTAAHALQGNLTGSIYSHSSEADEAAYGMLVPVVRSKVGRLLNDKMPTGVAVSPAMMHGGPYPSSGHPGFTAVGIPAALRRFAALQCFDNVRPSRLPAELRDTNPTGRMWRLVDGTWTQADITVSE